ncbi:MAG: hypothetical protein ABSB96_08930 [Gaiellaceae bacterium]
MSHSTLNDPCDVPSAAPLWIDFADGSVPFWQIFARPGVIGAGSSPTVLPQLRAAGAETVYFDLYMRYRVGALTDPLDTDAVIAKSNELFDQAVARTGCQTPRIAENELFSANFPAPWSAQAAQYRSNVLTMVKTLSSRGAHPYLLVPRAPAYDSVTAAWWREVSAYSDIVIEVYFSARQVYAQGPVAGSRRLRVALRRAINNFTAMGIPSTKLGIMLGFQVAPGTGGRESLEPESAWYREVKWQALAAKQIAREIQLGSIWSWGWGTWSDVSTDPDKEHAACVYLWTRSSSLCDALSVAGPDFNSSLSEGQIALASGTSCVAGTQALKNTQVAALARVTRNADVALSMLYARAIESGRAKVSPEQVLAVERAIIATRFKGSGASYREALAAAGASQAIARAIIADELREQTIAAALPVHKPSAGAIKQYYDDQGGQLVRLVQATPAPDWLGGRGKDYALASRAPHSLFGLKAGSEQSLRTVLNTFQVTPIGPVTTLESLPLAAVGSAIRTALIASARDDAFAAWTVKEQLNGLNRTRCVRDQMPLASALEPSEELPFLSLQDAYPVGE